jgi:N-methylhydantoinase A
VDFTISADMRFVGQAFEVGVDLDAAALARLSASELAERFAAAHHRLYRHGGEPGRRVEIVGIRFGIRRKLDALPSFAERRIAMHGPAEAPVHLGGRRIAARLLATSSLQNDQPIAGPALLEGYSSTTWVPPSWHATRDASGNIFLRRTPA